MKKAYLNLFIVILFFVCAFVIFDVYSTIQENNSAQNWEKTFGAIEDLPNKYPFRNDNEAAVQLKLLAVRLGIDFNVDGEGRRFTPLTIDANRLKSLDRDYSLWRSRKKELEKKDDSVDLPLPFHAKYLSDYRKQLENVRDFILTGPPILWRQNLNWTEYNHPSAALPNVYGIWNLQRIMSARILELAAARNFQEAEKYLKAQWKLNESLRSRCDLDSQHDALSTDIGMMDLMRKLPLAENWIPRIAEHDYKEAYIKGFTIEAWLLWRARDEHKMENSSMFDNMLNPYRRLDVSSQLEEKRKDIQRLQSLDPCSIGYKELRESSYFSGDKTYAEVTEVQLQRELTTKVIKVRHGYFPKEGSERSEACKDGTWEYWRSQDGSTTIKYKGRIELPLLSPRQFPSTFTVKNR